MGALVRSPKVPKIEPVAPPPQPVERQVEEAESEARARARKAALAAAGARTTMLTSPRGLQSRVPMQNIGTKTLLGQ